jgi:hypothetical protein
MKLNQEESELLKSAENDEWKQVSGFKKKKAPSKRGFPTKP